jgi:hypothetical protein
MEVFKAVTMKNAEFRDVVLCVVLVITGVFENRISSIIRVTRIGELGTMLAVTNQLKHATKKYSSSSATTIFLRSVLRLLFTAKVVPSSTILVTLMILPP